MKKLSFLFFILLLFVGCQSKPDALEKEVLLVPTTDQKEVLEKQKPNSAAVILAKKEVPVLCYHNIQEIKASDSEFRKTYTVTPAAFAEQMKMLHDNGYQTILPDQLYEYLVYNKELPPNPVLITFDDSREEHYRLGATTMDQYGFKGVFFIMTVTFNKPGYMTQDQIKGLSDAGHEIGNHTWDHHRVTTYTTADWVTQVEKPQQQLEAITGKPVRYFAYPYGLWNAEALSALESREYQLAFILSTKRDTTAPLYTVRRIIVSGYWTAPKLFKAMQSSFDTPPPAALQ